MEVHYDRDVCSRLSVVAAPLDNGLVLDRDHRRPSL
jgi:hypothetical protein